jgi:TM2 domain-containing membrane protein YozV
MSSSQAPTPSPEGASNPLVATILTWLIPGAGHFYLGKVRTAAIAFVVIEGLYLAGVMLSKGMFLQILPPEMRGRFAAALTPEAGNLGALLLHVRQYGFGGMVPEAFPSTLHVGVMLTASAGIANLILCSRAHYDARAGALKEEPSAAPHPGLAALVGWIIPGGGHFLQGRKARGAVAFVLVVTLFAVGCYLAGGTNLDRSRHFYYWAGQALLGPVAFIAETLNGHPLMSERPSYEDAGVVLSSVAGMLNVLLLLDVYGFSEAKRLGQPLATEAVDPAVESGPFDASLS